MKRIFISMCVLLAAAFVHGDVGAKPDQDPLTVNPDSIVLKMENSRVRVLEATLKPGLKEKTHSHPAYVVYVVEGGKFRNHAVDGTITDGEFKKGDVIYREPLTHWAENIGNTTIKLLLVELKN